MKVIIESKIAENRTDDVKRLIKDKTCNHWKWTRITHLTDECNENIAAFDIRQSAKEVIKDLRQEIAESTLNGDALKVTLVKKIGGKEKHIVLADVAPENVARLAELYKNRKVVGQEKYAFENPKSESVEGGIKNIMIAAGKMLDEIRFMKKPYGNDNSMFADLQEVASKHLNDWKAKRDKTIVTFNCKIAALEDEMYKLGVENDPPYQLLR